ncbi:leucine-rich repeat-containing protein 25 isoform X2 [Apodemus sylvaticus]|uniref:leucine-rich repeat-containing protein 25 isoform X2 n=1 Tax=Apodemus sylvaticus TaxID=10129 RepID=UPI002244ED46|nr:leucine-rich repeat-containing protein 25 isoform X2 [Apodemus sylvaticus]
MARTGLRRIPGQVIGICVQLTCYPTVARMGSTRAGWLWSCLLMLLATLRKSGSQDPTCTVYPSNVDWKQTFNDTCLNFSGLGLSLPWSQPLQASNAHVLDLSDNGLHVLPGVFFSTMEKLKILIVTHNPLDSVDRSLALRCDLELRADCSCGLASWHDIRLRQNCSGQQQQPPLCLHPATAVPRNLSTFLQVSCPAGWGPGTIGALVAGSIFLALAVSGSVLAWRLLRRRASKQSLSKAQNSHDVPRAMTDFLPRYSSRRPGPKAPDSPPSRFTTDYENVFIGQPAEDCSWSTGRGTFSRHQRADLAGRLQLPLQLVHATALTGSTAGKDRLLSRVGPHLPMVSLRAVVVLILPHVVSRCGPVYWRLSTEISGPAMCEGSTLPLLTSSRGPCEVTALPFHPFCPPPLLFLSSPNPYDSPAPDPGSGLHTGWLFLPLRVPLFPVLPTRGHC